ncbi:hypothetical protein [Wenxinia marina]|uniref:Uncharacterized protein n=1 Tax=Wenxinia marina DSM 24838 TaxID=1123501 RepID=A0A0D0NQ15_9RHOB|nr:hypothetical protein [Wenxinia marina]KIQ70365.1 hypothetical protein Wenmar_00741 [Wenxinia marina DSM 24838]GGL53725.1 hypothetical protein GCM10011392_05120 [Wenxinia marina]
MYSFRKFVPALALAALTATTAVAQSTQDITVRNRSGMTLVNFWASAQSNNSWENELLGSRVLGNGQNYSMRIRNVVDCNYDFRMEFSNGNVVTDVVNICAIDTYTITP